MNRKNAKEVQAVKRIVRMAVIVFSCMLVIITFFFIQGTCERYNEVIDEYELEIKNKYSVTNIERLDFLNTEEIIAYKKLLQETLSTEGISENVELTVLDTIKHNEDERTYDWLIVCDNQANRMYSNTYHESDGNFTVFQFEDTQEISEEDEEEIKDSASIDNSSYINGSIDNIAAVEPTIQNLVALSHYMDDEAGAEFSGKLLEFLVETNNNRRTFTVSTASLEKKGNEIICVLHPEIELNENNTIKAVYNSSDQTFVFEYTD